VVEIRKLRRADGVVPFDRWMATLRDARAKARILVQLDRLRVGLPGDWKAVGAGVFELGYAKARGIECTSHEKERPLSCCFVRAKNPRRAAT
jgi:putative addiction module killer protein